jgi:hypothetical protein
MTLFGIILKVLEFLRKRFGFEYFGSKVILGDKGADVNY